MGVKENLKSELSFQDMMVKELADKTGINKCTLDNYLREKHSAPTAENALKIAKALDVSVEYLITGEYSSAEQPLTTEHILLLPLRLFLRPKLQAVKCKSILTEPCKCLTV